MKNSNNGKMSIVVRVCNTSTTRNIDVMYNVKNNLR